MGGDDAGVAFAERGRGSFPVGEGGKIPQEADDLRIVPGTAPYEEVSYPLPGGLRVVLKAGQPPVLGLPLLPFVGFLLFLTGDPPCPLGGDRSADLRDRPACQSGTVGRPGVLETPAQLVHRPEVAAVQKRGQDGVLLARVEGGDPGPRWAASCGSGGTGAQWDDCALAGRALAEAVDGGVG